MEPSCLAVIIARGGSKRVPRKNVREMLGVPLLGYTIEAALESGVFARVVVSTDDDEIAGVAERFGADVPFRRRPELADDHTISSAVTLDALQRVDPQGTCYDYVAQLMPNCPLRTAADIEDSYRQFAETEAPAQISVTRYGWTNPWWARTRSEDFRLEPLFDKKEEVRSQDLPELFCPTGAVWWAQAEVLRREGTFYAPGHTGWELPWQRAADIDTPEDWQMTEQLMRLRQQRHERAADEEGAVASGNAASRGRA